MRDVVRVMCNIQTNSAAWSAAAADHADAGSFYFPFAKKNTIGA
jgi:hypothetical protein